MTALHYAARRGDVEIVTLLLEAGADPYIENEMGLNSFDITKKFGPFPRVIRILNKYKDRRKLCLEWATTKMSRRASTA